MTAGDFDLVAFIARVMLEHHDLDMSFESHAENLVAKMHEAGLLATDMLDLPAALEPIAAQAERILRKRYLMTSMMVRPLRGSIATPFTVMIHTKSGEVITFDARQPADAIDAAGDWLEAHEPERLEAEGWATLGVEPSRLAS